MNPLMLQNKTVAVTKVDKMNKMFALSVTVHASPMQLHTPFVQGVIAAKVKKAVEYLKWEGFVDGSVDNWKCEISATAYQG